jgi:hypothetical protein
MLLASWDADNEKLPTSLNDVNKRIFNIFGIEMWKEPDIVKARNKIIAIIENAQSEVIKH